MTSIFTSEELRIRAMEMKAKISAANNALGTYLEFDHGYEIKLGYNPAICVKYRVVDDTQSKLADTDPPQRQSCEPL